MADKLAKQSSSATYPPLLVPLPSSYFSSLLLSQLHSNYITTIANIQTSNPLKSLIISYASIDFQHFFKNLNRTHSRIFTSFIDNKAPLNKFLYKIGLHQTPLCDLCHDDEQDIYHILCNCLLLYLIRSNHFDVFTLRPPSTFHPQKLLSFLLDSDLYSSFID